MLSHPVPTRGFVGLEKELYFVHRATGEALILCRKFLEYARPRFVAPQRINPELVQSLLEWNSLPFSDFGALGLSMANELGLLDNLAAHFGARLIGVTGIHPTLRIPQWKDYNFWTLEVERYHWLYEKFRATRRFIPATTHLHYSFESLESAIYAMDRLRSFLPHFLWLSLSSPLMEGKPIGRHTGRMEMWRGFIEGGGIIGVPPAFHSPEAMIGYIRSLMREGRIDRVKSIWQYLRLHLHGKGLNEYMPYDSPKELVEAITVELRICDAMHGLGKTLGITGFGHGIVNILQLAFDLSLQYQRRQNLLPVPLILPTEEIEHDIVAVETHGSNALVHHPWTGKLMPVWQSTALTLGWIRTYTTLKDTIWFQSLRFVDKYIQMRTPFSVYLLNAFHHGGEKAAERFLLKSAGPPGTLR